VPATPREALALVGADPVYESYWIAAINDSSLPANDRRNLIEDLNEDGLSNLRNLSTDDVQLVANRIRLIDSLAPNAMDQVNAAAFQEARKDLVNMYNRATGQ
jgi:hypothetical protein